MKLNRIDAEDARRGRRPAVSSQVLRDAGQIVEAVRERGAAAVREYAERFGDAEPGAPIVVGQREMAGALDSIDAEARHVLERVAARIRSFADAQRGMYSDITTPTPGGEGGHTVEPVVAAGCYAPGGRYPLPSSVLMTAVTARAAGVDRVVVASPRPTAEMLAAAAIAGADEYLCVGGAHAIAALAYGFDEIAPVDVVVGPGNAWVTAAKQLVMGRVGIDMLAGPSELLVIADETADAAVVAADLLAQAEHDADASAMLVTTSSELADAVDEELAAQIQALSTVETARLGIANGFCCVVDTIDRAIAVADDIGAEHLEVCTRDAETVAARVRHAGGVFVGERSAEVFGDYGFGPNHTLPTGGTARYMAGLSVAHFLRLRTWLRIDDPAGAEAAAADAIALARMEGLAGHEASAAARMQKAATP